jgi:hypothetical protein
MDSTANLGTFCNPAVGLCVLKISISSSKLCKCSFRCVESFAVSLPEFHTVRNCI